MRAILSIIVLLFSISCASQSNPNAVFMAQKVAKKMQDSLQLNTEQRNLIYQANMLLYNLKDDARQNTNNPDSLMKRLQRIERRRDTLYFPILGSKYQLYISNKANLLNNN